MITRAPRPTSNFYMLDKTISEDKRLSWAARGMLVFLLGKPDHWQVSPAALVNETSKASRSTGRDGVYAVLKELKSTGYLRAIGARDESGTFAGSNYEVCESPLTAFPDTVDSPDTAKPDTAEPDTANPTQASIDPKQGLIGKQGLTVTAGLAAQPSATESKPAKQEVEDVVPVVDKPRPPMVITAPNGTMYSIPGELRYPGAGTKTHKAWLAYAIAYQQRYNAWPTWNATTGGQMAKFIARVGEDAAPRVAVHYVRRVNEEFVVRQMHPVKQLLSDAEKWATQHQTGASMTNTRARQADQTQANYSAADEAIALMRARRQSQGAANAQ